MRYGKFKHTKHGIRPDPIRAFVVYLGLLADRELLGQIVDTFQRDGVTCAKVRHFNGEPWPIDVPLYLLDVIPRD